MGTSTKTQHSPQQPQPGECPLCELLSDAKQLLVESHRWAADIVTAPTTDPVELALVRDLAEATAVLVDTIGEHEAVVS